MEERRNKKGQFEVGHIGMGGRPEGSRNKLTEQFYIDLHGAWKIHGASAIEQMAKDKPGDFVRCVASQMPKELTVVTPLVDLSDDELADLTTAVRTLTASATGETVGEGSNETTRH